MSTPNTPTYAHAATAELIFALAQDAAHRGAPFRQPCAQLLADSEARAVEHAEKEAQGQRDRVKAALIAIDGLDAALVNAIARAERAEAELAKDKARLDWLEAQENDRMERAGVKTAQMPFLVLGQGEETHWGQTYRAAIDAAMKEGA